jgi:hypothetical protein
MSSQSIASEASDTEPANGFALAFGAVAQRSPLLQSMAAMMRQADWPAPDVCFVPLLAPAGSPGVLVHSTVLADKFEHFQSSTRSGFAESQVKDGLKASLEP